MALQDKQFCWSEEVQYLFDLNGYYVFKNYFSEELIEKLRADIERIESGENLVAPVCHGKSRTKEMMYISNIAEHGSEFQNLIIDELLLDCIANVTAGYYRFNHSYAISHWKGGYTTMHMGGAPLHPKAVYQVKAGKIFSSLTKAVIPLSNHTKEDGCFCVVPGSHKSEFEYGNKFNLLNPSEHPNSVAVDASPGDLVIFTEALQHGGYENVSGRVRRTVYYCYSLGNVVDWGSDLNLVCSDRLFNTDNVLLNKVVKIKGRI
jgi:ectoine hydroxylase-related dioxygenase (phytanoyl-CoA dioxygenase family)